MRPRRGWHGEQRRPTGRVRASAASSPAGIAHAVPPHLDSPLGEAHAAEGAAFLQNWSQNLNSTLGFSERSLSFVASSMSLSVAFVIIVIAILQVVVGTVSVGV